MFLSSSILFSTLLKKYTYIVTLYFDEDDLLFEILQMFSVILCRILVVNTLVISDPINLNCWLTTQQPGKCFVIKQIS